MNTEVLESYFSESDIRAAHKCAKRLMSVLPHKKRMKDNRILLAYGGGKDSSYMVAWVRYIQNIIQRLVGETFYLRIATNRHAGMSEEVIKNIGRVYQALEIGNDDSVQCLLIDGQLVRTFEPGLVLPEAVRRQNRIDILMSGHKFNADARSTFCNACNFSMVNSFGLAANYEGGVDLIITGDSPKEQLSYVVWARRVSRIFNVSSASRRRGFTGFLQTLDEIAHKYFENIYGADNVLPAHRIVHELKRDPNFFNIYADTAYESGKHWALLTDFLGFEFDELMFSFSESDCGNPTLMAHIRALRAETLLERTYAEGIGEYVKFALGLMKQKKIPPQLITKMAERYADADCIAERRARAERFALEAFDLTEAQLVCMIYSPFVGRGRNLETYLRREKIDCCPIAVHKLLGDEAYTNLVVAEKLYAFSGLSVDQLRRCYKNQSVSSLLGDRNDQSSGILRHDPHKIIISVKHGVGGDSVEEVISGR